MSQNIIGTILINQYRVDAFIASGGMGTVYKVWDLKRNVYLAMKVLHGELADDPSMFKRFQREARALQRLAHPNIVPFYGLHKTDEFAFLLERFIDGGTLGQILKRNRGKALPLPEVLAYMRALCSALGYAHANGIVHCDVKPGNVMVDQGGNIYLTDFGIARHAESTTTTFASAGTPAYMAPEQIRGDPVTFATDVYALGLILFEMLTGLRPFSGSETGSDRGGTTANERIRYGHLNLAPPDPLSLNPNIPPALGVLIHNALAKNSRSRYTDAQVFYDALLAASKLLADQIPQQVYPAESMSVTTAADQAAPLPTPSPGLPSGPRPVRPAPVWLWSSIGIVLLILVAGLIFSKRSGGFTTVIQSTTETPTPTLAPSDTPTPAPTATITSMPTPTHTPTQTPRPTATPAYEWLSDFLQKGAQDMGYFNSMLIDDQGVIHLVYFQENYDIVWYDIYKSGKWNHQQVLGMIGGGLHLSLDLDSKGNPVIAYNVMETKKRSPRLVFLEWTGQSWRGPFQNIHHEAFNTDISMKLGLNDDAHFSFLDAYTLQVVYSHFSKDRFEDQLLGPANPESQSFPIAVDKENYPHLVYQSTEDGLVYAAWQGSNWLREVIVPGRGAGHYSAMVLDLQGDPHVVYYDREDKSLWYAVRGANGWELHLVDNAGDVGSFPSLAVDGSGFVHISYYDVTRQDLKYARGLEDDWSVTTVDSLGDVGQWTALALAPDGTPYIAYLDMSNEDLKLAKALPMMKTP